MKTRDLFQVSSLNWNILRIQTRMWDEQGGTKKYKTEITAETTQSEPRLSGTSGAKQSNNNIEITEQQNLGKEITMFLAVLQWS